MAKTIPAWRRLLEEGLLATRGEAERWILSGKVYAGGRPVRTAGEGIPPDAALHVRGLDRRYVAKGGLKLEGAIEAFGIRVRGRVCIDAGASTGGFTDCLIKHGAARVYAVDVGFGQLAGSLRTNEAVVNLERTNIGDESLLALDPPPTLGTVDLSYLSLGKAVPLFARILRDGGELLCLVKPLFETGDAVARRSGVIEETAYMPLLARLCDDFTAGGYPVLGVTHSPVTGNNGTLEFFLHLSMDRMAKGLSREECAKLTGGAVKAALALPIYHKG